jgi:hypothetical protein
MEEENSLSCVEEYAREKSCPEHDREVDTPDPRDGRGTVTNELVLHSTSARVRDVDSSDAHIFVEGLEDSERVGESKCGARDHIALISRREQREEMWMGLTREPTSLPPQHKSPVLLPRGTPPPRSPSQLPHPLPSRESRPSCRFRESCSASRRRRNGQGTRWASHRSRKSIETYLQSKGSSQLV